MHAHDSRRPKSLDSICLSLGLCLVNFFYTPVFGGELPTGVTRSVTSMPAVDAPLNPRPVSKSKNMALTEHEKQIAKELGFEESVLLLLKERLNPEMGIVKSGGLEMEDRSFLKEDYNQPAQMLEKDLKNYHDIAAKYPELKKLVDFQLPKVNRDSQEQIRAQAEAREASKLGPEKYERLKKFRIAVEPFQALIAQERLDTHGRPKGGMVYVHSEPTEYLNSDQALSEAIAQLHTKYDGKSLRPENKAKLMLGLKYKGVGDSLYEPDRRMANLRSELEKLGYRIADERGVSARRVHFETKAEAEKYLHDAGTNIDSFSLDHQKKSQYKAIYPFDFSKDFSSFEDTKTIVLQSSFGIESEGSSTAAMVKLIMDPAAKWTEGRLGDAGLALRLLPGSTVTKLGERHWLIDMPERYIVSPKLRVSTVFKTTKASSGFDMVRAQGTNGINSGIDNEGVIEKLKYWDKKYGVTVIEATFEGMKISFKNLPDDLSELCTEFFLFCPEIELSDDEHSNAARMRQMADNLRKTKVRSFWWD